MPEKYVSTGSVPILLRHTGASTLPEAPPRPLDRGGVVCLHDAGLQSSVFLDLLGALAGERAARGRATPPGAACTLAFDLPGHGRSGGLDALPSIEAMSACAESVTGWCRPTRPILVGHGMGALVALAWARRAPASIGGLVLCGVGAILGLRDEAISTMREVTLGRAPRPFDPGRLAREAPPELMRRAYMESIQTDPRATLVDLEASRAFGRTLGVGPGASDADRSGPPTSGTAMGGPVLVVCGASESDADRETARALATRLSGRFLTVERAGHWLPLEQPAVLAREILALAEAA